MLSVTSRRAAARFVGTVSFVGTVNFVGTVRFVGVLLVLLAAGASYGDDVPVPATTATPAEAATTAADPTPAQPPTKIAADSTPAAAAAIDPNGPTAGCKKGSEDEGLLTRLKESYQSHLAWNGAAADAPAAVVADGVEVPESNPPFPYSTWNIGGSETIGVDNMYYSALMDALYCGPGGQKLKDSRFALYGWVEPGGNLSTSHTRYNYETGTGGNYPAAYSFEPNYAQLDQVTLYLERTPDEVQRDHIDWGFRVTGLYGTDYKYTFSNGILSNQYLNDARQYGVDPVMYYIDLWFPEIVEGENLRIGRYVSIPDVEAQLAPNNLTYSHSLLYTYDPYTQTGIVSTTRLSKNWQIQAEISSGNDVAPWIKSERHLTPAACVIWTSDSGKDNIYPCMNTLNDSNWRWNNVQHAVMTWYHKFDSQWHMDTEIWYMWQSAHAECQQSRGRGLHRRGLFLCERRSAQRRAMQSGGDVLLLLRVGGIELHQLPDRPARHPGVAHRLHGRCRRPTDRVQDAIPGVGFWLHTLAGRCDRTAAGDPLGARLQCRGLRQSQRHPERRKTLAGDDCRGRHHPLLKRRPARGLPPRPEDSTMGATRR